MRRLKGISGLYRVLSERFIKSDRYAPEVVKAATDLRKFVRVYR